MKGPEWHGWDAVFEPADINFVIVRGESIEDIYIRDKRVGWIESRPHYCDRGRWKFGCELPGLDAHDAFPRYYMDVTRAKIEIISWLNWRLWRKVVS